jgi:uncharacterized membrane protein
MTQIVSDLAYLLQTELRLAKVEMNEKIARAANGGGLLGISAVLLLSGLFVLLFAVVRWLEFAGLPDRWGFLIVGGLVGGVGLVLAQRGMKNLKASALVPDRTIEQVRADINAVKEHVR